MLAYDPIARFILCEAQEHYSICLRSDTYSVLELFLPDQSLTS